MFRVEGARWRVSGGVFGVKGQVYGFRVRVAGSTLIKVDFSQSWFGNFRHLEGSTNEEGVEKEQWWISPDSDVCRGNRDHIYHHHLHQ